MKEGKNLKELAEEIMRQSEQKKDFIIPMQKMSVKDDLNLDVEGIGSFSINDHAHRQIGSRVGIPAKYYDRMKHDAPALLAGNINHWFANEPKTNMVRTLDGRARAFLSNSYRPIDNDQVANMALTVMKDMEINILSSELTERRLYLKGVFPKLEDEVKVGDPVQAGIVISNSEIGLGSASVQLLIYRLVCLNGQIFSDGLRKYHVGRVSNVDEAVEFYKDDTRQADDKAFMLKFRDTVEQICSEANFQNKLIQLKEAATGEKIESPVKAIETVQSRFNLNDAEKDSILSHLIEGGDLTKYGVSNAVTRASQDVENYDRATDMEEIGGTIITLPKNDWETIRTAA